MCCFFTSTQHPTTMSATHSSPLCSAADSHIEMIFPPPEQRSLTPPSNYTHFPRRTRKRGRASSAANDASITSSFTGLAASSILCVVSMSTSLLWSSSPFAAWSGRRGHYRCPLFVSAHGYLKSPRSRNLVACESTLSLLGVVISQQKRVKSRHGLNCMMCAKRARTCLFSLSPLSYHSYKF